MAIPFAAVGYGNNSTAQNVFGFFTDQALSSLIKYEAYDNDQAFPTVDTLTTVLNIVLAGTAGNSNISMISLTDTTNAAPASAWKPASPTGGEANPNRLKAQTNWVEQDGSILGASGRATYNMVIEVPSDTATTDPMGFDLLIRYTYTGTAPAPVFQANEGSEGTPTWTALTVSTHGIKHTRAGSSPGDLFANIPESSTEDTAEGWATT